MFVPAQGIYLLNHSVGRPPITTEESWRQGFLDHWENAGENAWPRWLESVDVFRAALAELLHGELGCFCPQVNLSSALTKILQSLPTNNGRKTIVYTEHDFPSIGYVLQQAQKAGYTLRSIPMEIETLDPASWSDYFSDDVACVLITHVHSNTGKQVPVTEISALAKERGIVAIIDIAQSVGSVPIDLRKWSADFVIGSCVKWLCGGPGAGFLWVDPQRIAEYEPIDVGWFSHENPFEFDIHSFRYADDALRFWGGTPSVQPYVTAANSIRLLLDSGIATIRDHNLELTQMLVDAVDIDCLVTPERAQDRGGTIVLSYAEDRQRLVCSRLRKSNILFDTRSTGIRLSPHIYNDAEEIEKVLECLAV